VKKLINKPGEKTMIDTLNGRVGVRVARHGPNGAILEEAYL
jgi:hypothetical protein